MDSTATQEGAARIMKRVRHDYADEMREMKKLQRKLTRNQQEEEQMKHLEETVRIAIELLFAHSGAKLRVNLGDDAFNQTVRNLKTDGEKRAVADIEMAFSPWSPRFIHGADTMPPIGLVATSILAEGERIVAVPEITWRKPITSNLTVGIFEGGGSGNKDQYACHGEMQTSAGRKLSFFCMEKSGEKATAKIARNPFAEVAMSRSPDYWTDGCEMVEVPIQALPETMIQDLEDFPEILAGTMMEIVTVGLHIITSERERRSTIASELIGGMRNVILPKDVRRFFSGKTKMTIRVLEKQSKKGKSGYTLIPCTFEFVGEGGEEESSGTLTLATTNSWRIMNAYYKSLGAEEGV